MVSHKNFVARSISSIRSVLSGDELSPDMSGGLYENELKKWRGI